MNKLKFWLLILFFIPFGIKSQMYTQKDIVNQFDPFSITINEIKINTNNDDFRENPFVIIMTITIGNEKIVKFLYKEDMVMNTVISYDDFYNVDFTIAKNNVILFPSFVNLVNKPNAITIRFEGYTNLYEGDLPLINTMSSNFCYTSSTMGSLMDYAYKYLAGSADINRPNTSLLTTATILAQNMGNRPDINYMGMPAEITYIVPTDPKKVIGSDILSNGKKTIESRSSLKVNDQWMITVTKIPDVKIVQAQPYYVKFKGMFLDFTSQTIVTPGAEDNFISKANDFINNDIVPGQNTDVYINDQVQKQLTYMLNLLKAGIRAKADTNETTNELMLSDEREALSYFETNLRENDFNLDNQYLYDDFISSSVNRGILQKEIDRIKRYFQIK